jgi:hypothetical protein
LVKGGVVPLGEVVVALVAVSAPRCGLAKEPTARRAMGVDGGVGWWLMACDLCAPATAPVAVFPAANGNMTPSAIAKVPKSLAVAVIVALPTICLAFR